LRHSFATHLIQAGYSTRVVQKLLGHKNVNTTEIYTHIADEALMHVKSPLDIETGGDKADSVQTMPDSSGAGNRWRPWKRE
jgi:hypothetical protein